MKQQHPQCLFALCKKKLVEEGIRKIYLMPCYYIKILNKRVPCYLVNIPLWVSRLYSIVYLNKRQQLGAQMLGAGVRPSTVAVKFEHSLKL